MRVHLAFLFVLFTLTAGAGAHPLIQEPMWVLFEPGHVRIAVNVSAREIGVAQGWHAGEDGAIGDEAKRAQAARQNEDYVARHLHLVTDGRELIGQVTKLTPPPALGSDEQTVYQYELDYLLAGSAPSKVTLSQDMLREFPYAAGMAWDVSYVMRIKRAGADEISTGLLRSGQPFEFPTGWSDTSPTPPATPAAKGWGIFSAYLWQGVKHILTGYDHLLFVSALVLAALSFWDMVKVIAAFTLAHTITLALSVFDIFRLPPWVVEPVIALSIIFVALENVLWPQRARSWIRLTVAFSFGLIHGLGFAGGLLEAMEGLPSGAIWIALGAFSLGVEIGHQLVVLPLFGLLAAGRRRLHERFARPVLRYGSLVISFCGAYYFCVAIHEQFFTR